MADSSLPPPAADAEGPATVDPLAQLVARQRTENEQLRVAMRTRAVIEQAKGILVARTGEHPEVAFRRLVRASQESNRRVVEIAAEVVARSVSGRPSIPRSGDAELLPGGGEPASYLMIAAVIGAPDLRELLEVVVEHARPLGATGGMLALAEPDGALRIVAAHGTDLAQLSAWHRLPPSGDLPLGAAARDRVPQWFTDRSDREARYRDAAGFPGHGEGGVALPLLVERRLVGVLVLDWSAPLRLAAGQRTELESVAAVCAAPVAELLRIEDEPLPPMAHEPGGAPWFLGLLDALPVAAIVLDPTTDEQGIVDARVLHVNAWAARAGAARAPSVLELCPALSGAPIWRDAGAVLTSGTPVHLDDLALVIRDQRVVLTGVTLARVGSLLVASWRQASTAAS